VYAECMHRPSYVADVEACEVIAAALDVIRCARVPLDVRVGAARCDTAMEGEQNAW